MKHVYKYNINTEKLSNYQRNWMVGYVSAYSEEP